MQKSLLDIQQEIRVVERQINVLSNAIKEIYKDIASLRNDEVALIDYKKIRLLSTNIKFDNHPLNNLPDKKLCHAYIELLLRLVHLDKDTNHTIDRLVFLQWLLKQAKLDLGLEKLFYGALKRDQDNLIFIMESLPTAYSNHLIMDSLLIANMCGKANGEILNFVADLCSFLCIKKEKLKAFSIIAKNILQQNTDAINWTGLKDTLLYVKEFEHYLGHNVVLQAISEESVPIVKGVSMHKDHNIVLCSMREQRVLVAKIHISYSYDIIWIKRTGYYVTKGDVICTYRDFGNSTKSVIKSPCTGRLYVFKNGNIHYVVVHHENDRQVDVKEWVLARR